MAAPSGASEESFYVPPASDAVLPNISGCEVHNVILCFGDGMGFNHVSMARHYGASADKKLFMELLPISGRVTTYSANKEVTDGWQPPEVDGNSQPDPNQKSVSDPNSARAEKGK